MSSPVMGNRYGPANLIYMVEDGLHEAACCRDDRARSIFYFWKRCGFDLTGNSRFAISKDRLFSLKRTFDDLGVSGGILGAYVGTLCERVDNLRSSTRHGGQGIQLRQENGSLEELLDDHDNDPWLDNGAPNQHRDNFIAVVMLAQIFGGAGCAFVIDEFFGGGSNVQALAPTPMPNFRSPEIRTAPPVRGAPPGGGGGNWVVAGLLLLYALSQGNQAANDGPIVVSPPPKKMPLGFGFTYDPNDPKSLDELFAAYQRHLLEQQGWRRVSSPKRSTSDRKIQLKGNGNAGAVPRWRPKGPSTVREKIDERKKHIYKEVRDEAALADRLANLGLLQEYHLEVQSRDGYHWVGEVDMITQPSGQSPGYIIEYTEGAGGKLREIAKLLYNNQINGMNPQPKPVILFAPNYSPLAEQDVFRRYGKENVKVVRHEDRLIEMIRKGDIVRPQPQH